MKTKKTRTIFLQFILIAVNILIINNVNAIDGKNKSDSFYCIPTKFATILYANGNSKIEGKTSKYDVGFILNGSCKFYWSHDIKEKGEYVAVISYAAVNPGSVVTYNNQSPVTEELPATFGTYETQQKSSEINFVRRELKEKVTLAQGIQEISITLNPFDKDTRFMFYSLELIPVSAAKQVKSEIKRATAARPNMKWFTKLQYGVMFHWTAQSMPKTGKQKAYKDAVKDFDVNKFASMVKETGADYVIFTTNHASPHFPAPLKEWEKVHPGWTTERDLIVEIADALQKNNIKLILYFATHVYGKFRTSDEAEFTRINKVLITEVGNRYKDKVAGYWFDGWYQCFSRFPGFDFESFYKCCKVGNANRVIALNSWLYPTVNVWQDYWAGEVYSSSVSPKSSIIKEGAGLGLQFQALIGLEGDWVYTKENKEIPAPVLKTSYLTDLIKSSTGKGPITLNVLIYQDGSIGEKSMDVLKTLKTTFKK
jgi:hypothetical protein